ncbi:cellulose biosynthesis protein BcsR [Pseudomonas sp.]|uniref:cellulose biosynthesis protein BcsR n=1 Tax=Pseudomonas sp. TaxID=306 RepID=UPI0025850F2C|nr:cellulose biosynthesis protein BcsR [Pseudomonas sp.]
MASLPAKSQVKNQTLSRYERADDIARLKAELHLPSLEYVDVSALLELSRALKRWPLLADFAITGKQSPSPVAEPVQPGKVGALK